MRLIWAWWPRASLSEIIRDMATGRPAVEMVSSTE